MQNQQVPNYAVQDGVDLSLMTESEIEYYNKVAHYSLNISPTSGRSVLTPDTLSALVEKGPLEDGDVPSKTERNQLIKDGLAVRILVKGEDGNTAATYFGRDVYKYIFGKSDSVREAKAFRQAKRIVVVAAQKK